LRGRAVRDAAPAAPATGGYPLVIISHGYPGNRYLLSHLGENLASKGYVVAAPDHPDSTYGDQKAFASTLYNRPLDQVFVLDEIDRLSRPNSSSFLAGLVDARRTAIVGYSMGGYGLMSALGAGFTDAAVSAPTAPPNRLLFDRAASNPAFSKQADPRIKAAIAIAPYGGAVGMWNAEGLSAVTTPILFVAGSADDIVGYEKGVRALFQQTARADRHLLTFVNGAHNVAAPIPAPAEAWAYSEPLKNYPFMHYEDGVWSTVRSNNILQHFATAFLAIHLKGEADKQAYLAVGAPLEGFKPRTTNGLTLEYLPAAKSLVLSAGVAAAQPPAPAPLGAKADYHVHPKGGLTIEEAVRRSKADGITYGVAINGGLNQPAPNAAAAEAFLQAMRQYPVYVALQAEGREWVTIFSNATLAKFDYIFTDAMTWTDDAGRRMRLWIAEDVGAIADPERFMDTLVARATKIFAEEPVDLYVNPTFLPEVIRAEYDTLWTPARVSRLVDGLAASGIGMEINNRYRIPSQSIIMAAKKAGVKFACGTNNTGAQDLGRNEYCAEMIKACDLRTEHFWAPPAEGKKAIQRKPLPR